MANVEEKQALADMEMGQKELNAIHPTPAILEQARLGNLDLFQAELRCHNHPLNFRAGPDVYWNRTALHLAAMQGHDDIVEFLLSHPDISREVVNAKDPFGYTPLHLAVRSEHESVVRLLVTSSWVLPDRFLAATYEPDDLGEDCGGHTPLHFAAFVGNTTVARMLLRQPCQVEFGYDPVNIRAATWHGETPMDIARRKKFVELGKLLESSDVDWLQQERQRNANSANAILVGAALVVAATFGTWLQPPGGIPAPASTPAALASTPAALASTPASDSSFDHNWNLMFFIYVSFAFGLSMIALVVGTLAAVSHSAASLEVEVQQLRTAVKKARDSLLAAIYFLMFSFSCAGKEVFAKVAIVNGKYAKAGYEFINYLPFVACIYIIHFIGSYTLKMGGQYGNWRRVTIIVSLLAGAGIGYLIVYFVE